MANALEKIIARKNSEAKKPEPAAIGQPSAVSTPTDPSSLSPCPTCHSPIRWLNASNAPRCISCQPPKFAALVRSKQVLAICDQSTGERAWERLIEAPDGRLLSESGIRELAETGGLPEAWRGIDLHSLTAARVGGGDSGWGEAGDGKNFGDENLDRWREIDPDEFFGSKSKSKT